MFVTMALTLATTTSCTDVKRVCRACPVGENITRCSTIGIACQPSIRICRPKVNAAAKQRRSVTRP